jgi:hypothetical protein
MERTWMMMKKKRAKMTREDATQRNATREENKTKEMK